MTTVHASRASRATVAAPRVTGETAAVCRRREPSQEMRKPVVAAIELDVDRGVVGDVHEGAGDRQVALIALDTIEVLREATGSAVDAGAMGENLVLGVPAGTLIAGARVVFAGGAVLEVTGRRTPCVELDAIAPGLLRAAVAGCGVFARVVAGGRVGAGTLVEVLTP